MTITHEIEFHNLWNNLQAGEQYRTPDLLKGVNFTIESRNEDSITIRTSSGRTSIPIRRQAFEEVLRYLRDYDDTNPCPIGSKHNSPGELSLAASRANGRATVVITYILPILLRASIVGIYGGTPQNTTWLS